MNSPSTPTLRVQIYELSKLAERKELQVCLICGTVYRRFPIRTTKGGVFLESPRQEGGAQGGPGSGQGPPCAAPSGDREGTQGGWGPSLYLQSPREGAPTPLQNNLFHPGVANF